MVIDVDQAERTRLAELFAVADEAIDAGVDVIPAAVWVRPDGTVAKRPLTVHGHLEAHRDRQLIRQQLVDPPHVPSDVPAGFEVVVAVVPGSGGFVLLDCDVKSGKAGSASLQALMADHGGFVYGGLAHAIGRRQRVAPQAARRRLREQFAVAGDRRACRWRMGGRPRQQLRRWSLDLARRHRVRDGVTHPTRHGRSAQGAVTGRAESDQRRDGGVHRGSRRRPRRCR